jgi:hypothetical protein
METSGNPLFGKKIKGGRFVSIFAFGLKLLKNAGRDPAQGSKEREHPPRTLPKKNRISHYSGSPTGIRFLLSNFGNLAIPNLQDPRLSVP